MIAKAHAIKHGASMMSYAMAKPHALILRTHNLPQDISPESVWAEMLLHQSDTRGLRPAYPPVKNWAIRFELSPQNKETDGWKAEDYLNLIDEFNAEMVKLNQPFLEEKPHNFDLDNTQYTAALHFDSKGGIRHIHIVANRIDMNGQVIDDHNIGRRIVAAIHNVNVRHGWELPEDIHDDHLQQINEVCMDALKSMQLFDWDEYGRLLEKKGLKLKVIKDKSGSVVAYTVHMGNSKFKASDLGKSRNLTAKNILYTWSKFHLERPAARPAPEKTIQSLPKSPAPPHLQQTSTPQPQRYTGTTNVDGKWISIDIPMAIYSLFKDNCAVPEENDTATLEDVTKAGIMLFMGLVDAATTISESHGGGGSQPESGWGRKEDEDERRWAMRCAQMATEMFKPKPIRRSYHR